MERRVLFAIFLCFLVLYLWQSLVVKPVPKPAAGAKPATAAAGPPASGDAGLSPTSAAASQTAPEAPQAVPTAPAAAPVVGETTERDVRVETDAVIAVFTN